MSEAGEGQLDVLRVPARNIDAPKLVFNLPKPAPPAAPAQPAAPIIWKPLVSGDEVVSTHLQLTPGEYAAMCPGSREPNPRGGRTLNVRKRSQTQGGTVYSRVELALPYIDDTPALDLSFTAPGAPRPYGFPSDQSYRAYRLADYLTLRLWHYGWISTDRAGLLGLLNTDPKQWDLQFDSESKEHVLVPVTLPGQVFAILNTRALNFYNHTGGDTFKTRSAEADDGVDTFGQDNYTDKPWLWEVYQKTAPAKLKPIEYFYRQWALDQPEEKDKLYRTDRTWYTNADARFGKTLRAVFAIEHALAECWVVSADGLSKDTVKSHIPVRGRQPGTKLSDKVASVETQHAKILKYLDALHASVQKLDAKFDALIKHLSPSRLVLQNPIDDNQPNQ